MSYISSDQVITRRSMSHSQVPMRASSAASASITARSCRVSRSRRDSVRSCTKAPNTGGESVSWVTTYSTRISVPSPRTAGISIRRPTSSARPGPTARSSLARWPLRSLGGTSTSPRPRPTASSRSRPNSLAAARLNSRITPLSSTATKRLEGVVHQELPGRGLARAQGHLHSFRKAAVRGHRTIVLFPDVASRPGAGLHSRRSGLEEASDQEERSLGCRRRCRPGGPGSP